MSEEDKRAAAAVPESIPGREDDPPPQHQHTIEHGEGAAEEAAVPTSSNMSGLGTIDYPHQHTLRPPPPASPVLRHDNDEDDETQNLAATLQRTLRVERSSEAEETAPQQHELSPGLLSSLRGSSSPSYSQVSVGSVGPTATMLPPTKPCDLTPVTRNTSGEYHAPVTPGGTDFLHGEHLALPADLNDTTSSSSSGPSMPPLKIMSSHHLHQPPPPPAPLIASGLPPHGNEEIPEQPNRLVQFPARKYYSFTTREQYEQAMLQGGEAYDLSDDEDDEDKLTPYAPVARPANFDIESLPDEELQQIFAGRHSQGGSSSEGDNNSESNNCKAQHRLLAAPIPLEGRIPSLHLANRLMGGSTHSLASTTSLASVNTAEDEDSVVQLVLDHSTDNDSFWNANSSHSYDDSGDGAAAGDTSGNHPPTAGHSDGEEDVVRRHLLKKRKQLLKETQAVEWLQSLDSSQVAEAASSKFLLTKQQPQQQQQQGTPAPVPLKRITSTPVGRP